MEILASLLSGLKAVCAAFPDPRKGRIGNIAMADFGLSAFAMFFMQSASFLSFQRTLEKGQGRSNCQTLFGIEKIPSDDYIRDMLDEADPALLAPCFQRTEQLLLEPAMGEAFGRLGGGTLIALDGTEYFCSRKIACRHCQTRKRSNGKIESRHSMLACDRGRPGTFEGRSAHPGVHRQTGRRREAGLRAQRRQTLAREACGATKAPAP